MKGASTQIAFHFRERNPRLKVFRENPVEPNPEYVSERKIGTGPLSNRPVSSVNSVLIDQEERATSFNLGGTAE